MILAFVMGVITATALIILVSYTATIGDDNNEKDSDRPRD